MRFLGALFKILIYLVLLLAVALAGGYLWLTRYVQTPEFAQKVQNSIRTSLGTEIQFEQVTFNVIRGLEVEHIKIPNPKSRVAPVLIEARKLQLGYAIAALINNEIQIANFRILDPVIYLEQDPITGFVLPLTKTPDSAKKKPSTLPALPEGWKVSVKSIELQNASLRIVTSERKTLVELSGVELLATLNSLFPALTGTGTLHISSVKVGDYTVKDLSSSLSVGNNDLNLSNLEGNFYQGQLTGNFEISLAGPAYAYTLKLDGNAVEVNQMLAASTKASVLSGKLSFKTTWRGPLNSSASLVGKGTAEIVNGQMIDIPVWKIIGQLPGLGSLSQPDFSQITTAFDVANQSVAVNSFLVKSALAELSGSGSVSFDKILDLQARLSLNPETARLLPLAADEHLSHRVDGYREVAFNIKGPAEKPSVDLAQKLMLENLVVPISPASAVDAVKGVMSNPGNTIQNSFITKPTPTSAPAPAQPISPDATPTPSP